MVDTHGNNNTREVSSEQNGQENFDEAPLNVPESDQGKTGKTTELKHTLQIGAEMQNHGDCHKQPPWRLSNSTDSASSCTFCSMLPSNSIDSASSCTFCCLELCSTHSGTSFPACISCCIPIHHSLYARSIQLELYAIKCSFSSSCMGSQHYRRITKYCSSRNSPHSTILYRSLQLCQFCSTLRLCSIEYYWA